MGRTHPNVLKAKKQKRQGRRAYLTSKFSGIHVPRTVGQTAKPEMMAAVGFTNRFPRPGMNDELFNLLFPPSVVIGWMKEQHAQEDKEIARALADHSKGFKRRYALQRAEEEAAIERLLDHEEAHNCITVRESLMLKSRLTFLHNSRYTHCYFIETFYRDNGGSYMMKSAVYEGRERIALLMQIPSKISWVEFLGLPSLIPVLPRSE